MKLLSGKLLALVGIVAGAAAGYAWYSYAGCPGGTCPITSSPYNSMAYGAILGGLLLTSFTGKNKKNQTNEKDHDHS